jgi:hypothetical protein
MPKRYYISPVIGDGTRQNKYRPKISERIGKWSAVASIDLVGKPFMLLIAAGTDVELDNATADTQNEQFPAISLSTTWGSLQQNVRNKISNALTRFGLSPAWIVNSTTLREILSYVGRELDPAFALEVFDVSE